MAGCFGNHPVDRYLEGQLNKHLAEEDAYNSFADDVFNECMKIDPVLTDTGDFDLFWDSEEVSNIISSSYYGNDSETRNTDLAKTIMDKFLDTSKT